MNPSELSEHLDGISVPVSETSGDQRFARLVRAHFDGAMQRNPALATYLGIHAQDHRLADLSRAAKLAAIGVERGFLADLEAIDAAELA